MVFEFIIFNTLLVFFKKKKTSTAGAANNQILTSFKDLIRIWEDHREGRMGEAWSLKSSFIIMN